MRCRPRSFAVWSGLAVAALAVGVVGTARASAPADAVTALSEAVIHVLKDDSLSTAGRRTRVEKIVYDAVDFDTLSRLVLARNWRRLSEAQQAEFQRDFKKHLSATYGKRLDSYANETVDVTGEREEARGDHTVRTVIRRGGGNADILVDYRLRRRDEAWKIIDFVIEGVSLVANFRSQFQDLMSAGGPEGLLDALRKKTAAEQPTS